jgi:hypothetical protein
MDLSLQLASGARTTYFLREGVRRRHVPSRWRLQGRPCHVPLAGGPPRDASVIVRVLVMLDIYFVSVKYVLVSVKLMCVYVKLLKI